MCLIYLYLPPCTPCLASPFILMNEGYLSILQSEFQPESSCLVLMFPMSQFVHAGLKPAIVFLPFLLPTPFLHVFSVFYPLILTYYCLFFCYPKINLRTLERLIGLVASEFNECGYRNIWYRNIGSCKNVETSSKKTRSLKKKKNK